MEKLVNQHDKNQKSGLRRFIWEEHVTYTNITALRFLTLNISLSFLSSIYSPLVYTYRLLPPSPDTNLSRNSWVSNSSWAPPLATATFAPWSNKGNFLYQQFQSNFQIWCLVIGHLANVMHCVGLHTSNLLFLQTVICKTLQNYSWLYELYK